jgi:hypothetical protein
MPILLSVLVDVQDIYVDKINPNFYDFFTQKCPVGCVNENFAYFVSDWTGDSHLTHYLTSILMVF